jgi:hypothetical protein
MFEHESRAATCRDLGGVMSERAKDEATGISRRRMLKRIGAGAAVAWSAPILTSINTSAYAATGPCAGQPNCLSGCNGHLLCGNPCFCMQHHVDKACVCIGQGLCAVCSNDADCDPITGPGSVCVDVDQNAGCCVGISNTACQPPCGGSFNARRAGGRPLSPAR